VRDEDALAPASLDAMKNDILLKDGILAEGDVTGVENMKPVAVSERKRRSVLPW
jgi:hypothetical protein